MLSLPFSYEQEQIGATKHDLESHVQKNVHMNKAKAMIENAKSMVQQKSFEVSWIFDAFVLLSQLNR